MISILAAGALLLTGCTSAPGAAESGSNASSTAVSTTEQIAALGLDVADPKALIDGLDALALVERPTELIASVRPNEVILQPGGPGELVVPTDDLDFYLSIAPFVAQTHDCGFHSLTTCVGEQQNQQIDIEVTDPATGEIVLSEATSTADNGFVGLWLPRDRELLVTIVSPDGRAEQVVRTGANDITCLTTMQLKA